MNYTFPKIDYDSARSEYIEHLNRNAGVMGIVEFGEIKAPGLSDIDWLIILDESKTINADYLLPNHLFSNNFKEAFQHRPIFYPNNLIKYLNEFIIPTPFKTILGSQIDLRIDKSINPHLRNLTLAFDFFKRQKKWLRKPIFEKLSLKKKVSLFVSISKHNTNPLFSNLISLCSYSNAVKKFRNNLMGNKSCSISIEKLRVQSIENILEIERFIAIEIIDYRSKFNFINKKYYSNIIWSEEIMFDNSKDILSKSLISFPNFYKCKIDTKNGDLEYFKMKYQLIKKMSNIFLKIGLNDGLIADMGFNDWFPKSIRYKMYLLKSKFLKNFN